MYGQNLFLCTKNEDEQQEQDGMWLVVIFINI